MKRSFVSLTVMVLLSAMAYAQVDSSAKNQPSTPAMSAEQTAKRMEIRKLIELTGAANVSADALRQIISPLKAGFPDVPEAFWDTFTKEVHSDELIDLVIPIYDRYYTRDEIKDLTAF